MMFRFLTSLWERAMPANRNRPHGGLLHTSLWLAAAFIVSDARADAPLFSSHELMNLAIPVNFLTLCRPRETPDCDYTPTVLEYEDSQGQTKSIAIEIKIRGGYRSLTKNCSVPLLFIRFNQEETAGTPFEGQAQLPLTTHCGRGLSLESVQFKQRRSTWEQYLLKEYLAYLLYNTITDVSLNARLVQMTYPNPDKPRHSVVNYAFFTEHFRSAAKRNGDTLLMRGSFDHEKLDSRAADLLALFQYLIGNTDWSIARERNLILLQDSGGQLLPLPYDFDMSGLVNAHYAGPAQTLPIEEVTDRYYLGYCHPDTDWDSLFDTFLAQQEKMLSMIDEIPSLDRHSTKKVRYYLEQFFITLNSIELREKRIQSRCQPWPPAAIDHTTPDDKR
jgi:hypothetical protein